MVIGQHPDGRIFLMAHEHGLGSMIRSKVGIWKEENLSAEEMNDFMPIRDELLQTLLLNEAKQSIIVAKKLVMEQISDQAVCICPSECDCANPEPQSGVALISNACPEHNLYPEPVDECPAEKHNGGQESK